MPSPFPGMDPFVESQNWSDFHTSIITAIRDALVPLVRPKYVVGVEARVYIEQDPDDPVMIRPDVTVMSDDGWASSGAAATAVLAAPVECLIPMPEPVREAFLAIRRKDDAAVVTVIELLSPTNKRPGATGYDEYLAKRNVVLASSANLVELDLLRRGRRPPLVGEIPHGDYRVTISRPALRPRAQAYVWSLEQTLPRIPIPLHAPDEDVHVNLQELFTLVYDRAGYDYSLDYEVSLEPPLEEQRGEWVAGILGKSPVAGGNASR